MRAAFTLDPDVVFLNHGSYGACPRVVLDAQTAWRQRIERQPVQFFARDLEGLLDEARTSLAKLLHTDASQLAFVPNATTGVNAVIASLALSPGDELCTTDHVYNACGNALDEAASRTGARVVVVPLPLPLADDIVVAKVIAALTPRTRLLLIDHVTSPTAALLPVETITAQAEARGVPVLVDGAHAPGMLPLHLNALGASYYVGNCHKWLCAPKGAAFVAVRADRTALRPLVTSHARNSARSERSLFLQSFDWTGTDDPSAILSIPSALQFLDGADPNGIAGVMARNRQAAIAGGHSLVRSLGGALTCPDSTVGSMRAVLLPARFSQRFDAGALQLLLLHKYRIEVPIIPWPPPPHGDAKTIASNQLIVRISMQVYNTPADVMALCEALVDVDTDLR